MQEQHKKQPEISIIVPVYKTERFLSACISSILAQTFTDFELIRVNPKPPIYQNFAKQNTLFRVAAHEKGCFAWILPWCEEESCYLGKRLRPRFPWQKYNSFHN